MGCSCFYVNLIESHYAVEKECKTVQRPRPREPRNRRQSREIVVSFISLVSFYRPVYLEIRDINFSKFEDGPLRKYDAYDTQADADERRRRVRTTTRRIDNFRERGKISPLRVSVLPEAHISTTRFMLRDTL